MAPRMTRLLPGRPGLMLILGVVVAIIFGVGFVNQALMRRDMLAQYAQAQNKVERLEEQNRVLQQDLDRAQQGQLVPQRAWEYFGKTPKGVNVIVVKPEAAEPAPAAPVAAQKPAWRLLLERWVSSLTGN
ncbi:MAG: Cell division protein FtsL [Chloroflexi bacterium ADurb.Bin325]|nr:MAG: Cell division protein FtsL [Chloroflexi bacterium ADurb.Bin325]